jgi:hypothetical protein
MCLSDNRIRLALALSVFFVVHFALAGWAESPEPLSAEEIVRRARLTAKQREQHETVYTFSREVVLRELAQDGEVESETTKRFRAFTDQREQELLEVDGHPATVEEVEAERSRARRHKRRFLNADPKNPAISGGREENLMDRNISLFHRKFTPQLEGVELVRGRDSYVLHLQPNRSVKVSHAMVNKVFNELAFRVWIDTEDFEVARLEAELQDGVSFLGGLAGVLKEMAISVEQVRLANGHWVDQTVAALFDARLVWKTYHFGMESQSEGFAPLGLEGQNTTEGVAPLLQTGPSPAAMP